MPSIKIITRQKPYFKIVPNIELRNWGYIFGNILNQDDLIDYIRDQTKVNVVSIISSPTPTLNCDTTKELEITGLASDAIFNITGTPSDGQKVIFRYKDNDTSRILSLGSVFVDLVGMPANTTIGKVGIFGARWAEIRGKWEIIATVTEP